MQQVIWEEWDKITQEDIKQRVYDVIKTRGSVTN